MVFDLSWDSICNLGIKCNASPIARKAGVRMWSSPFDNIDTVDGLAEVADILSARYEGYFTDINDWDIRNDLSSTGEFRTKIFWHKDTPKVFYPHFNERWLTHDLTPEGLKEWFKPENLDLAPIWPDFIDTFGRRSQRLMSLMDVSKSKLLFLRIEEPTSIKRILNTNVQEDAEYFMSKVTQAYPSATIGMLYIFIESEDLNRNFNDTSNISFKGVKPQAYEDQAVELVKKLKLVNE